MIILANHVKILLVNVKNVVTQIEFNQVIVYVKKVILILGKHYVPNVDINVNHVLIVLKNVKNVLI